MRIEDLDVALASAHAWEAVELGTALVRRHAAAVWTPWLLVTLLAWAAVNALCWSIRAIWLASLGDVVAEAGCSTAIPLYVLSRAVFGQCRPRAKPCVRSGRSAAAGCCRT
jgi:hypothetical protein